ncbi:PE family protein [Glycomyces sambucus]|uniref:PE family protein n=1 Tax=Glycomyces sambucus TaxID=380244 RepID=A0A1G9KRH4_9ACTN|nr:PE domain-containing protein [Glycomyces sambucus]SDL52216.1 PE family protein [Glycomyces sambucus]
MSGFEISPETMRRAAEALETAGTGVQELHDEFTAAIEKYADAFGGDDIGTLLGTAHGALSGAVTECFTSNIEELAYYSASLREMAESHQANDDVIAALFAGLSGEIDDKAGPAPAATE